MLLSEANEGNVFRNGSVLFNMHIRVTRSSAEIWRKAVYLS